MSSDLERPLCPWHGDICRQQALAGIAAATAPRRQTLLYTSSPHARLGLPPVLRPPSFRPVCRLRSSQCFRLFTQREDFSAQFVMHKQRDCER